MPREQGHADSGSAHETSGSSPIGRALAAAEGVSALDGLAQTTTRLLAPVLGGGLGNVLRGSWLGHPLHPVLVTVPIGAWTAAPVFDLTGRPAAAQTLVTIGLAAAVPAATAGLAEYTTLDTPQRRVALLHAATNSVAMTTLVGSMIARKKGFATRALALTVAGLGITGVSGALGGHLSYVQAAGVQREAVPAVATDPLAD
ncbi:DUF2231 domain-containing protein [Williamsia deligens]|uniref:DUF2231 domain-containing protein n=1 Tax=Williamsia deligens TaxID=321325 RepID=A0ABW3GFR3_9NOCA|nr:DUF2231 domain-containing protein [Williamsia deligens]MCP2195128.1 putative membrane protein [Williamsia deligens]